MPQHSDDGCTGVRFADLIFLDEIHRTYDHPLRVRFVNTLSEIICRITGADSVTLGEVIQTLWSGYGVIQRAELRGSAALFDHDPFPTIVKHIDISHARANPRGWASDRSHQRKVFSYQVEQTFYEVFSTRCGERCRVPDFIGADELDSKGGWVIILSDLDFEGFGKRKQSVEQRYVRACLAWLANFHACFMGDAATGLWPVGTYWHLETRPDEFKAMPEGRLRSAAELIDQRLNSATYQTLVHGDAKIANFCFSSQGHERVAAVDFQYVGRGCGMKDFAYFISSCLSEQEAERQQDSLLDFYFEELQKGLAYYCVEVDFPALESEWRALYPFAWADFCRFLAGWSPGHWKLNSYSEQLTTRVLEQLDEA